MPYKKNYFLIIMMSPTYLIKIECGKHCSLTLPFYALNINPSKIFLWNWDTLYQNCFCYMFFWKISHCAVHRKFVVERVKISRVPTYCEAENLKNVQLHLPTSRDNLYNGMRGMTQYRLRLRRPDQRTRSLASSSH